MPLRTVVVEDEPLSMQYICSLLARLPEIEIVAKATMAEEAVHLIQSLQPHLIFLDIELHTGTGFDVLKRLEQRNFALVFTTALDHHAIKMLKLSGIPFLQKPIDLEELEAVIKKVAEGNTACLRNALHHLLETLHNNHVPLHLALQQTNGIRYIKLNEILRIENSGDKTILFINNTDSIQGDKSLQEYESLLGDFGFFRVAATHLVHLQQIKEVVGDLIVMHDGTNVPLSPKKRDALISKRQRL